MWSMISSDDLKVIDVSDPGAPILVGSLSFGHRRIIHCLYSCVRALRLCGRYSTFGNELKVIDISGAESHFPHRPLPGSGQSAGSQ